MMTGLPGVFAGGDVAPSARSVTVGIGHGKTAAAQHRPLAAAAPRRPRRPAGGVGPVPFERS